MRVIFRQTGINIKWMIDNHEGNGHDTKCTTTANTYTSVVTRSQGWTKTLSNVIKKITWDLHGDFQHTTRDTIGAMVVVVTFVATCTHRLCGEIRKQLPSTLVDSNTNWLVVFILNVFAVHGLSEEIVCDNGQQFTSFNFNNSWRLSTTKQTLVSPYHLASNAAAEGVVWLLKQAILNEVLHAKFCSCVYLCSNASPNFCCGIGTLCITWRWEHQ